MSTQKSQLELVETYLSELIRSTHHHGVTYNLTKALAEVRIANTALDGVWFYGDAPLNAKKHLTSSEPAKLKPLTSVTISPGTQYEKTFQLCHDDYRIYASVGNDEMDTVAEWKHASHEQSVQIGLAIMAAIGVPKAKSS